MNVRNKYYSPEGEQFSTVLANNLRLTTIKEINKAEFKGFLYAYDKAFREVDGNTLYNLFYLLNLHRDAFHDLYDFAGKIRKVNISKGDFMFPVFQFLEGALNSFQNEFLDSIPANNTDNALVLHLARLHAELLFIHPFREGNGRTIRLFTSLIYFSRTGKELNFELLVKDKFTAYIAGVQQAANKQYDIMEALFLEMQGSSS